MILKTYGHATLSFEKMGVPALITDPWLIGSCYWRSWWLQHYPSNEDLLILSKAKNIFLTHEHWDHAHFPTLKKYFLGKKILIPELNSKRLKNSLKENFDVEEIKSNKWFKVGDINYISVPLYNDDSILLFEYQGYLICNMNDSKATPQIIKRIYELKKEKKLNLILLQSYAPASINNSFRRQDYKKVSIKSKKDYVKYIMNTSNKLDAEYFVPFASQATFSRPDSIWANEFKVSWEELYKMWGVKTKLLKSYIKFDLDNHQYDTYVDRYLKSENMDRLGNLKYQNNINKKFDLMDLKYFSKICKSVKYILFLIYPLGINFYLSGNYYKYNFLKEEIIKLKIQPKSYLEMPINEFIESIKNCQFTDLGTSFVMKIFINSKINIIQTYLFFIFLTFSEKGYFSNFKNFIMQIKLVISNFFPKKLY